MTQIKSPDMLQEIKKAYLEKQAQYERQVLVCGGAGCVSCHCQEVKDALIEAGCSVVEIEDKAPWVEACQGTIEKNTSDQAELYQQLVDLQ